MAEKKVRAEPAGVRRGWIEPAYPEVSLVTQCQLLGVSRSSWYAPSATESVLNQELRGWIDQEYTDHPFYGSRRMTVVLRRAGYPVNRKRVIRLMTEMGLQAIYPKPATSTPHPDHRIYPYLLRGVIVTSPDQVWSTDITYIHLPRGFGYLAVIMDWYSRKILAWRLSNTLETGFCLACLEAALGQSQPLIFNTDQGAQFTSLAFTGRLAAAGIQISMDGRGRAHDNIFVERLWRSVKYEEVYPKAYDTLDQAYQGLEAYFTFYNEQRPHQALNDRTPAEVYADQRSRSP